MYQATSLMEAAEKDIQGMRIVRLSIHQPARGRHIGTRTFEVSIVQFQQYGYYEALFLAHGYAHFDPILAIV